MAVVGAVYLELWCALFRTTDRVVRYAMALFIGRVVGTKMQKTAKVEVTRLFLHPQVLKVTPCQSIETNYTQAMMYSYGRCSVHVLLHIQS